MANHVEQILNDGAKSVQEASSMEGVQQSFDNAYNDVSHYLPETKGGWFDFWTNTHYDGGQSVTIPVSNDHIPVFVRAGSIVPMTDGIITYPGADGEFYLYDDDGETNDYLKGKYEMKRLVLKNGKLKIRKAK